MAESTSSTQIMSAAEDIFREPSLEMRLHKWNQCSEQLSFTEIVEPLKEGPNRGKSILWFLANCLAEEGNAQPFQEVWQRFKHLDSPPSLWERMFSTFVQSIFYPLLSREAPTVRQLTLQDFLVKSEEGEYKGQSVLWQLATGCLYSPAPFLEVWKKYESQISLQYILVKAEAGPYKGQSLLSYLARLDSGFKDSFEAFTCVWNKFQNEIPLSELIECGKERENKDVSILWCLGALAYENPAPFLYVWNKYQDNISINEILFLSDNPKHKHKSLLWILAATAMKGQSQPFLRVWEKHQHEIGLKDVTVQAEEKGMKVESLLLVLAWAVEQGYPEPFLRVWNIFKDKITLEHLKVHSQIGHNKGKSVLWVLVSAPKYSDIFSEVWPRIKNEVSFEDLTFRIPAGIDKGTSILWWIAGRASGKKMRELFLNIWEKFKDRITSQTITQSHEGLSILWFLASHTVKFKDPMFFRMAWDKFQDKISLADVTKGKKSVLWFLAKEVERGFPQLMIEVLETIPGPISNEVLESVEKYEDLSILDTLQRKVEKNHLPSTTVMVAILARNVFFLELEKIKAESFSDEIMTKAFALAEKAEKSGYLSAFYHVGQYFNSLTEYAAAFKAYDRVPSTSFCFDKTREQICEHHFALAMQGDEKRFHIRESLRYCLQTKDSVRGEMIQRIAVLYITGKKEIGLLPLVPESLLEAMNDTTTPEWCFDRFDEIKKMNQTQEENTALKERLAKFEERMQTVEESLLSSPLIFTKQVSSRETPSNESIASLAVAQNTRSQLKL